MVLSKSNYMLYLKHPAWLWLEKHDKGKLPEIDEDTQALFDMGNLFESYAEKLFSDGITLGYKTNGEFDWNKYKNLPDTTEQALGHRTRVLFQGRLEIDGITCIFDVLERNDDGTYNLYEIKSSTTAKTEHEYDLAFQTTVLERSGLTIANVFVIHVNNEYVRDGAIDYKEITTTTEVTSAVRSKMDITAIKIDEAKSCMTQLDIPNTSPRHARLGAFSSWMEVYRTLTPDLEKYSIFDLHNPGARRVGEFEDDGILSIRDIPEDTNLTVKQHHQVLATQSGERLINSTEIHDFLKTFKFPLYFLDYETLAGGIPPYDGLRPYQQMPFQYSLHKLASPEAELEHVEYLHTENMLPVEELVKQLKNDISTEGSVVVWYQSFEKGCNTAMAELAPEYSKFLYDLNDRIVDLMIPFAEGWYVDKDFLGSASIKAVLPVLVPTLSYKELNIRGGQTAQRIWMKTVTEGKDPENKAQVMSDLIKYCTLDTLAMVEIWKILKEV